jgi:hypothetical protein
MLFTELFHEDFGIVQEDNQNQVLLQPKHHNKVRARNLKMAKGSLILNLIERLSFAGWIVAHSKGDNLSQTRLHQYCNFLPTFTCYFRRSRQEANFQWSKD